MATKRFWQKKTPLDKLSETDLRGIVLKQERVFRQKDRELNRMNKKRKQLLEQAKEATPTERDLLREKYKQVRNEREMVADEYRKSLALYRVTSTVHQIKRASTRNERAVDVVEELGRKTGLSPEVVHQILTTHDIADEVKLEPWNALAEELDEVGIMRSEFSGENAYDEEFDTMVDILTNDPSRSAGELISGAERAQEAKRRSDALEL